MVSMHGGGMHGERGAYVAKRGRHGRGHEWQGDMCSRWGPCVAGRACVIGGMHGRGHAWQGSVCGGECIGGMHATCHAWQGVCMAEGACWQRRGVRGGGMHGRRDSYCSA